MITLQENTVKFNNNLIVSHDGGRLSSDSGLVLIDEFITIRSSALISRKIIQSVTVYEDHFVIAFKSGIEIEI